MSPGTSDDNHTSTCTQLVGHRLAISNDVSAVHFACPRWRVTLGPNEMIWETILNGKRNAGSQEEASSVVEKDLGDRRTLYKYLNRHLRVVLIETRGAGA